jgi:nitrous oxide reductase accessory protein NosL
MTVFTRLWVVPVCFLLLMSAPVSAEEKHERDSCRVCGMYIDEYVRTAAELVYKDGRKEHTCGMACMLRLVEDAGGPSAFTSIRVHDWSSGEEVDAQSAYYVIGSNVIPDMLPNYIAFSTREAAEAFAGKEKGEIITFAQAIEDVSPAGTTSPFRIRTAVTPGRGNFSTGFVYGYVTRNSVKMGSSSTNPSNFISGNRAQPKAPDQFRGYQQGLFFNYSPMDDLALFMNVPWYERRQTTLVRNPSIGRISSVPATEDGIGDIDLEARYNLWHATFYDQFVTLLVRTSLPTGEFDGSRTLDAMTGRYLVSQAPALQLGQETATVGGGLLYSQRWKDFWFHGSAVYNFNAENHDDYKFGDNVVVGAALHYTPNYDLMLGLEADVSYAWKNEDQGFKIGNTGGTRSNLAFVFDWRFLNVLGGNFKLRGSAGFPVYENLNYREMVNPASNQPFNQVQLGGGFFANLAITWTTRFNPFAP